MKKSKVLKVIGRAACALLAVLIIVCGVLFFPLTGEKNTYEWSGDEQFDIAKISAVSKERDDFKILMLTDTQLWTKLSDNKRCYEQMNALVEKTQPDLITLPGDVLSAFASRFSISNFIKTMDSYGIPWAPVFGNHDSEIPTNSRNWQGDRYMKSEYCLFEKGPSNLGGCGNYTINITENGEPVYTVFMLDNGEYGGDGREVPLTENQIAWYEWSVKGIENAAGRLVPSMTFSHFAQPEFAAAYEAVCLSNADGFSPVDGEYGFGGFSYSPCAPAESSGFVDKCRELGSTKYFFCGHDHENNASVTYDGMTYTFGLKTGPSPAPWNGARETGGTLITLTGAGAEQNVNIEHIVMEKVY